MTLLQSEQHNKHAAPDRLHVLAKLQSALSSQQPCDLWPDWRSNVRPLSSKTGQSTDLDDRLEDLPEIRSSAATTKPTSSLPEQPSSHGSQFAQPAMQREIASLQAKIERRKRCQASNTLLPKITHREQPAPPQSIARAVAMSPRAAAQPHMPSIGKTSPSHRPATSCTAVAEPQLPVARHRRPDLHTADKAVAVSRGKPRQSRNISRSQAGSLLFATKPPSTSESEQPPRGTQALSSSAADTGIPHLRTGQPRLPHSNASIGLMREVLLLPVPLLHLQSGQLLMSAASGLSSGQTQSTDDCLQIKQRHGE